MEGGEPETKKRKLNELGEVVEESNTTDSVNEQQEQEEDVVFECLNCSG